MEKNQNRMERLSKVENDEVEEKNEKKGWWKDEVQKKKKIQRKMGHVERKTTIRKNHEARKEKSLHQNAKKRPIH